MAKRNYAEMEDVTSGTLTVETGVIFYLLGNPVLVLKLAGKNRFRVFTGGIETVADGEVENGRARTEKNIIKLPGVRWTRD